MTAASDTLAIALEAAVPLWMLQLDELEPAERHDVMRAWATAGADAVASKGDTLMFKSARGETAATFNALARGLAALAFCPGGVTFAGRHWEAS